LWCGFVFLRSLLGLHRSLAAEIGFLAGYQKPRKGAAMLPISTILHPTDFSPLSEEALRLAYFLAKDHGARLIVLHVREIPVAVYGEFGYVPVEPENDDAIREQLSRVRPAQSTPRVEHVLRSGNPAEEIVRIANETPCDLIVMGTHGRTGFARMLMGSVAENVMRKAPCPVLTIKMPFHPTGELAKAPVDLAAAREKPSTAAPPPVTSS
jgi:nucleotide-binding universal stress UspA family protein